MTMRLLAKLNDISAGAESFIEALKRSFIYFHVTCNLSLTKWRTLGGGLTDT